VSSGSLLLRVGDDVYILEGVGDSGGDPEALVVLGDVNSSNRLGNVVGSLVLVAEVDIGVALLLSSPASCC